MMKSPAHKAGLFFLVVLCLVTASCAGPETLKWQRPVTVAVWPFEDLSANLDDGASGFFMLGLTDEALMAVDRQPGYEMVERSRLEAVLREQNLGSGSLADQETRLRLGRLLGARCMLFGTYQRAGDTARIDLRLVDVETSRLVAAENMLFDSADEPAIMEGTRTMAASLLRRAAR